MSEASRPNYSLAHLSMEERASEVLRVARDLNAQNPDWVTYYRYIFGVDGMVARLFPRELRLQFVQTEEHAELQRMLNELRKKKIKEDEIEPVRMITVRLPASLHEALRQEAHDRRTSINKLCITKLLQVIDEDTPPAPSPSPESGSADPASTGESE